MLRCSPDGIPSLAWNLAINARIPFVVCVGRACEKRNSPSPRDEFCISRSSIASTIFAFQIFRWECNTALPYKVGLVHGAVRYEKLMYFLLWSDAKPLVPHHSRTKVGTCRCKNRFFPKPRNPFGYPDRFSAKPFCDSKSLNMPPRALNSFRQDVD